MTNILALDIATVTGWARGRIGETPTSGSVRFGGRMSAGDVVFGSALTWLEQELTREPKPDILIMESLLPADAMRNRTQRHVRDRLAGLHGIVRATANRYGIGEIAEASVANVRAHFIGRSHLTRLHAKRAVMEQCNALGWAVANDNQGDACALWSYCCGLIDPAGALRMTPLFNKALRVRVWP